MIELISEIFNSIGRKGDSASLTGSLNAKLTSLLPLVQGTTKVSFVKPTQPGAPASGTTGGSVNTFGSWAEVVAASVLPACAITHVAINDVNSNEGFMYQIGTGGAGSESAIWDGIQADSQQGAPQFRAPLAMPRPLRIAANTRVSVRAISNGFSVPFTVVLMFIPTPY